MKTVLTITVDGWNPPDLAPILDALIESLPELAANIESNGGLKLRGYMLEQVEQACSVEVVED